MKRLIAAVVCCIIGLCGCSGADVDLDSSQPGSEDTLNMAEQVKSDFEIAIFSDKKEYKTTEKINVWATLCYQGENDTVTIWHGDPYINFFITDGKEFNTNAVSHPILTSTVLTKDTVYRFDYFKSGGYTEEDPKAKFWKEFYGEKDLKLPAGDYTISVVGDFALSEDVQNDVGLKSEIKIKVYR